MAKKVQAITTTQVLGGGLAEGGYYALLRFASDNAPGGELALAIPSEELHKLAEIALACAPQRSPEPGETAEMLSYSVNRWTVSSKNGLVAFGFEFGKGARIFLHMYANAARALRKQLPE